MLLASRSAGYRACNVYIGKASFSREVTREEVGLDMKNYAPRSVAYITLFSLRRNGAPSCGCSSHTCFLSSSSATSRSGSPFRLYTEDWTLENSTKKRNKGNWGGTEIEVQDWLIEFESPIRNPQVSMRIVLILGLHGIERKCEEAWLRGADLYFGEEIERSNVIKRNGGARHAALSSSDEVHAFTCIAAIRCDPSRLGSLGSTCEYILLSISDYRLIAGGAARSAPIVALEQ